MTTIDATHCEEVLVRCIERARAAGLVIHCEAYITWDAPGSDKPIGCCALGAYDLFGRGERLGLPDDLGALNAAWSAIENGFDGSFLDQETEREWHAVGARLRDRFAPVSVETVEGSR